MEGEPPGEPHSDSGFVGASGASLDEFTAHCPSLRSCWSQGRTREEALNNIREAIDLYLEPVPEQVAEGGEREIVAITL
jgi:hypothetical protein